MSITRTRLAFERDFVQIPNKWMRDTRLSRKARGLLAELMTHTVGWEVSIESLQESGPEGRDGLRVAINELERYGYLKREQERVDGNRFGGTHYMIQDPDAADLPSSEKPSSEFPSSEKTPLKKTKPSEDDLEEHHPEDALFPAEEKKNTKPAKRARRLTSEDELSTAGRAYAEKNLPGHNIDRLFEEFKNYWIGEGKAKVDWEATWRNRVMVVADRDASKVRDIKSKQTAVPAAPTIDPYGDPRWA